MSANKELLTEEDLSTFLKEIGIENSHRTDRENGFDSLLEEIEKPTPLDIPPSVHLHDLKHKKKSLLALWVSLSLLLGIFSGTVFGYFWAKNPASLPKSGDEKAIFHQLEMIRQIVGELSEKLNSKEVSDQQLIQEMEEVIEPLPPLNLPNEEWENLAPSMIS